VTVEILIAFANSVLSNPENVLPHLLSSIEWIQGKRNKFWMTYGNRGVADDHALKQWVANYELSDFMQHHTKMTSGPNNTVFVRYNQWPQRNYATADEAVQLLSEERFGGRETSEGTYSYDECDSVYFIETFEGLSSGDGSVGSAVFYSPEEWEELRRVCSVGLLPRVALLDLNGHFVCAVAVPHHGKNAESCTTPDCRCRLGGDLIVINTTANDYISGNMAVAWAFDALL
jgi:hypothetical protein